MKLNELEARLPAMYFSSLEDGGPSYYFTSEPGRGKTSVVRKFKRMMKRIDPERKYGIALINGANFTLMTAMGFMVPKEDGHGHTVSVFTQPYWFYDIEDNKPLHEYDGGLVFVDEYDKMGVDEKKIVGEAALTKRLGNHNFPPGWVAMFAGNTVASRSGSTRDLMHMINRRIEIAIKDDVESWSEWAKKAMLLPEVITFAEENPQLLFEPLPADQRPWCTPRSLEQANIHLKSLMKSFGVEKIPVDPLTQEEVAGGIGVPGSAQLFKTIRLGQEVASYEKVLANPDTVTLPSKPDGKRLLTYKLAQRVSEKDAPKILQCMQRLEQEFQTIFVRQAIQQNYKLAFVKEVAEWCGRNTALIAILNRFKNEAA
jgi:hypothetical protein